MDKERLTYETELGISLDVKEDCPTMSICHSCDVPPSRCKYFDEAINKLAEYESLEEQGLLLRLPCKVGDKAWYVHRGGIDEVEVDSFVLNVNLFVNVSLYIGCDRFGKTLTPYKTLFFTQSEAEEKLRELEKDR